MFWKMETMARNKPTSPPQDPAAEIQMALQEIERVRLTLNESLDAVAARLQRLQTEAPQREGVPSTRAGRKKYYSRLI